MRSHAIMDVDNSDDLLSENWKDNGIFIIQAEVYNLGESMV